MKKILSFDIDNTLNEPKMPIFPEMAELLATLSQKYIIAPISGQKYDQFLIQIINNLPESANLDNFHLFVASILCSQRWRMETGLQLRFD